MLTVPANVSIFVAAKPIDGRKSFRGLVAIVQGEFQMEATSGNLFVFVNKRCNQIKLLFWDRNGFWLMCKRLEQGTFRHLTPLSDESKCIEIDTADLGMLLEGVDLVNLRRKRYKLTS